MFAKVAEERSFAAAAQAMGVSVATVSRAVTRLEERLGGRLFNRTSRRLALTDYGYTLAERASKIFADAVEAEDFAREASSRPRGLVKLTAPESFGVRWVAPMLPEMSNTQALGALLYTKYVYVFQAAGVVLLIAMIGAIVLTLRAREGVRRQVAANQIYRSRAASVEVVKVEIGKGI